MTPEPGGEGPVITGFDRDSGPVGAEISIFGQHFGPTRQTNIVRFSTKIAKVINVQHLEHKDEIRTVVPLGLAPAQVPVTVEVDNRISNQKFFTVTPNDYRVGTSPDSVVTADFNKDGYVDLATSNHYGEDVSVLLGDGYGGFGYRKDYLVGGDTPSFVITGDFDEDGNLDLAVANEGLPLGNPSDPGNVSVLLGNGDGTFQPAVNYAAGISPCSIAIGDLNGDGHQDLAVANLGLPLPYGTPSDPGGLSVLLGNGDGTFQSPQDFEVGGNPISVAIGDFDRDGHLDLATANSANKTVSVLYGVGARQVPNRRDFSVGGMPWSVITADFNRDALPDLATANYGDCPCGDNWISGGRSVSVLLGETSEGFLEHKDLSVPIGPTSLVAGDFNGDGCVDLATASWGDGSRVSVLLGRCDGDFLGAKDFPSGTAPFSVATADFNNDSRLDLTTANMGSDTVSVLLGDGSGGFSGSVAYPVGDYPVSAVAGDLNGDGHVDLAVANSGRYAGTPNVSVLLGNGDGTFQSAQNFEAGESPVAVAMGDFNGDGYPDLAVAMSDPLNVSVLLGNGDGTFQPQVDYSVGQFPTFVAVGDLNGDGHPDLAVANYGSHNVSVLINKGDGTFKTGLDYGTGACPASVAIGDLNGDRKPDLAVANLCDDNVAVLMGNGDGTFQAAVTYEVEWQPTSVAIGDFDADSHLDLAIANSSYHTVSILFGDGSGRFPTRRDFPVGGQVQSVVLGDFNEDGKLDLSFALSDGNDVTVLLGKGNRDFEMASTNYYRVGMQPQCIITGDFNGDKHLDLVTANSGSNNISILIGDGNGEFFAPILGKHDAR